MKKAIQIFSSVGFLVVIAGALSWQYFKSQASNSINTEQADSVGTPVQASNLMTETEAQHQHTHANTAHNGSPWQASPFDRGEPAKGMPDLSKALDANAKNLPPPEKEIVSAEELARRKKMEDLGYMVPTDYYNKDLKTLKAMAKAGDAYAMVHLGEKYAFELNGQVNNPEFEKGMDYPAASKQAFKDALVAGNIRSAGIIAELYLQEKNAPEAYAWHLVSEQLGDSISADWFKRTDMAQQASEQLKKEAVSRATQIMNDLKLSKKQ